MGGRPAFADQHRAGGPLPAHAQAQQRPPDDQLRQAAGGGGAQRAEGIDQDRGHQRPGPSDAVGQGAENDAAQRRGQQRDGHQQPRRIESEAELPLQGRDGHQIDDEIEGIERPARLRRQQGLPLLGGQRAIPGARRLPQFSRWRKWDCPLCRILCRVGRFFGRLAGVDGVCSWSLVNFRPLCPLPKRRQWVKLVVSVLGNRWRPKWDCPILAAITSVFHTPSRRTWQKTPKHNSSRWTSATASGWPRCIAATKKRDLTVRAVLAGMIFGGLMSLSNLYVGLKTGWGLGVDIAAVVVIFAVFKSLRAMTNAVGITMREFGIMENTMMMTVAVAASWISSAGLVSAVPAMTMLTGYQFVWWQLTLFIAVILYLGLFMAIPLKRQMIQVDSLRFPANIPTGETLLVMYSHGGQAMKKAVSLGIAGLAGILVAGLRDGLGWIPAQFNLAWRLRGIALGKLTLSLEPSLIFVGIGALFGIKVGLSMLLGLVLNYGILAPRLIENKIIDHPPPKLQAMAAPQLPLAIEAGQTFAVELQEAVKQPELPTAKELKAHPELASAVSTRILRYTWTRPTVYENLAALAHDLNAETLQNGAPNPLHGVRRTASSVRVYCRPRPVRRDRPRRNDRPRFAARRRQPLALLPEPVRRNACA